MEPIYLCSQFECNPSYLESEAKLQDKGSIGPTLLKGESQRQVLVQVFLFMHR